MPQRLKTMICGPVTALCWLHCSLLSTILNCGFVSHCWLHTERCWSALLWSVNFSAFCNLSRQQHHLVKQMHPLITRRQTWFKDNFSDGKKHRQTNLVWEQFINHWFLDWSLCFKLEHHFFSTEDSKSFTFPTVITIHSLEASLIRTDCCPQKKEPWIKSGTSKFFWWLNVMICASVQLP